MVVELCGPQPLVRAEEQQLSGDGFSVGADDVDLDVVAAGPVAADCRCGRYSLSGQYTCECLSYERFDGAPAPRGPAPEDAFQRQVRPHPVQLGQMGGEKREPEPQVSVCDAVPALLRRRQADGQVTGDHALADQQVSGAGKG